MSERISEDMPEDVSERMLEDMSERISEDVSERNARKIVMRRYVMSEDKNVRRYVRFFFLDNAALVVTTVAVMKLC